MNDRMFTSAFNEYFNDDNFSIKKIFSLDELVFKSIYFLESTLNFLNKRNK